jgi:hypothetical protein
MARKSIIFCLDAEARYCTGTANEGCSAHGIAIGTRACLGSPTGRPIATGPIGRMTRDRLAGWRVWGGLFWEASHTTAPLSSCGLHRTHPNFLRRPAAGDARTVLSRQKSTLVTANSSPRPKSRSGWGYTSALCDAICLPDCWRLAGSRVGTIGSQRRRSLTSGKQTTLGRDGGDIQDDLAMRRPIHRGPVGSDVVRRALAVADLGWAKTLRVTTTSQHRRSVLCEPGSRNVASSRRHPVYRRSPEQWLRSCLNTSEGGVGRWGSNLSG